ncbi:Autophagy protein 22 [Blyttiomyces sp. JEL0837]|nr:Autophagy protein 22 [Blyttiomyces sp. JEL0837]
MSSSSYPPTTAAPEPAASLQQQEQLSSSKATLDNDKDNTSDVWIDETKEEYHDLDSSVVTRKELKASYQRQIEKAWYNFAFISEGYSALGTAIMIPIIIQTLAAESGYETSDHSIPCQTNVTQYSCVVNVGGTWIDTSSTSISVLGQLIFFFTLGALADYGGLRKNFLIGTSIVATTFGVLFLTVTKSSLYWLAALFYIFGNIAYGFSYVFFYSWLPILVRNDEQVIEVRKSPTATLEEVHQVTEKVTNLVSSKGFMYAYTAAVIEIILGVGVALAIGAKAGLVYGLQCSVAFASLWWIGGMYHVFRDMKTRPGPPLPRGTNVVVFSITKLSTAIYNASKLKNLFFFLLGWFMLSDGAFTIIAVALLYAQTELGMTLVQLLALGVEVPLVAGLAAYGWNWYQRRYNIATRSIILAQASLLCVLPIWGLLGFVAPFGLRYQIEMYFLAAWYGFLLGSMQSSCRSLFSMLLPPGFEAEFFSLYEITDKGSAWVGPLVVGAIGDGTHNKRYAFFFLLFMFLLSYVLFYFVDVDKGRHEGLAYAKSEIEKRRLEKEAKGSKDNVV